MVQTSGRHFSYFDSSSQENIPIVNIIDGIIKLRGKKYIGVVEVIPSDFFKQSPASQNYILEQFAALFSNTPALFSIKITSDLSDPYQLVSNIHSKCRNQEEKRIKETIDDATSHLYNVSKNGAESRRFFIHWSYSKELGQDIKNENDIINQMREIRRFIIGIMHGCSNTCRTASEEADYDRITCEYLYYYFNRKTCKKEHFIDRYNRVVKDYETFEKLSGIEKRPLYSDLIAPKGLYFTNRKYVMQDGIYYGYLGIDRDTWPNKVEGGWINWFFNKSNFPYPGCLDVDIIFKKLPQNITKIAVGQYNRLQKEILETLMKVFKFGDMIKNVLESMENTQYVKQLLDSGDELLDVGIILTLRSGDEQTLNQEIRTMNRSLKKAGIKTTKAFLKAEDYYNMTMPFLYLTTPFKDISHNVTTSQAPSLYCMTSYEKYDPSGYYVGLNYDNSSMVAINNFNTEIYPNANIVIVGSSGNGKTFLEQHLAQGMFLNGIDCYFLIPQKGYEYIKGCKNVNGTYVSIIPGSSDCLNIGDIHPEHTIDATQMSNEEDVEFAQKYQKASLMVRQIQNIIMWIQLQMRSQIEEEQYAELEKALRRAYFKKGITDDNETIYKPGPYSKHDGNRPLKEMPIIGDFYEEFIKVDVLKQLAKNVLEKYITGNCQNLNGQTNVDMNNHYVVVDCDKAYCGNDFPAFQFLGFIHIMDKLKENLLQKKAVVLDEVWQMLLTSECAEIVNNAVRLVRGYGACTVMATQEIKDFLSSGKNAAGESFGESVLSNSKIKFLLGMEPHDLEHVRRCISIDKNDENIITKVLRKGDAYLFCNDEKIRIKVQASQRQFDAYNTDVNKRKLYV